MPGTEDILSRSADLKTIPPEFKRVFARSVFGHGSTETFGSSS